jgi:hypothetical protein
VVRASDEVSVLLSMKPPKTASPAKLAGASAAC